MIFAAACVREEISTMPDIRIQRVYDLPVPGGGRRILVDRLWPRGLTKEQVHADHWLKEIAPSTELRQWFSHDPAKWRQFKERYFAELDRQPELVARLLDQAAACVLILLYSARDPRHNQAVALREYLLTRATKKPSRRRTSIPRPRARPRPTPRRRSGRTRAS